MTQENKFKKLQEEIIKNRLIILIRKKSISEYENSLKKLDPDFRKEEKAIVEELINTYLKDIYACEENIYIYREEIKYMINNRRDQINNNITTT